MEATRGCPWMALRLTYTPFRSNSWFSRVAISHDTTAVGAALRLKSDQVARSPAMPRRQKKAPAPENDNEALTLLTLQQQVLQLTEARATLANVVTLVRETPLHNFTSAQDRRTLSTAQSCLDSLSIRLEAHANTVEETVKQKQLAFLLRQRQATGKVHRTDSPAPSLEGVSGRVWARLCCCTSVRVSEAVLLHLCFT